MNRRKFLVGTAIFGLGTLSGLSAMANAAPSPTTGIFMNTAVTAQTRPLLASFAQVAVRTPVVSDTAQNAVNAAFAEGKRLGNIFSRFNPQSPLYLLNHAASLFDAPTELSELLQLAGDMCRLTDGHFDITTGADSRIAINDGYTARHSEFPILTGKRVYFLNLDSAVSLDGIAKGFIAERMAQVLQKHGLNDFAVNIDGDIKVSTVPAGHDIPDSQWQFTVYRDDVPTKPVIAPFVLGQNSAVSVSGDLKISPVIPDVARPKSEDYSMPIDGSATLGSMYKNPAPQNPGNIVTGCVVTGTSAAVTDAVSTAVNGLTLSVATAILRNMPDTRALLMTNDGRIAGEIV